MNHSCVRRKSPDAEPTEGESAAKLAHGIREDGAGGYESGISLSPVNRIGEVMAGNLYWIHDIS